MDRRACRTRAPCFTETVKNTGFLGTRFRTQAGCARPSALPRPRPGTEICAKGYGIFQGISRHPSCSQEDTRRQKSAYSTRHPCSIRGKAETLESVQAVVSSQTYSRTRSLSCRTYELGAAELRYRLFNVQLGVRSQIAGVLHGYLQSSQPREKSLLS